MEKEETLKVKSAGFEGKKLVSFVGDIKQEFKRIEWTSKEDLVLYTKIVLASTFIFGLGIYFVDLAIQGCLWSIQNLIRIIVG